MHIKYKVIFIVIIVLNFISQNFF